MILIIARGMNIRKGYSCACGNKIPPPPRKHDRIVRGIIHKGIDSLFFLMSFSFNWDTISVIIYQISLIFVEYLFQQWINNILTIQQFSFKKIQIMIEILYTFNGIPLHWKLLCLRYWDQQYISLKEQRRLISPTFSDWGLMGHCK